MTQLAHEKAKNASLKEANERLQRSKTRRAVPNPNARFMTVAEALASNKPIPDKTAKNGKKRKRVATMVEEEVEVEVEEETQARATGPMTRAGRTVKPR